MADVPPNRSNIALAAAQFRAAVSEFLAQRLAGQQNFINYFQHSEKQFFINGPYSIATLPVDAVDGLAVFEFQAQIINAWMFNLLPGSAGTTELDVLIANPSGTALGSWTSIFSTTPKITSAAAGPTWVQVTNPQGGGSAYTPPPYTPPSGTTQGTLNTTITSIIPAYTAIRCDLKNAMTSGENAGILIHYRPI